LPFSGGQAQRATGIEVAGIHVDTIQIQAGETACPSPSPGKTGILFPVGPPK
jgi:hypothetical protein